MKNSQERRKLPNKQTVSIFLAICILDLKSKHILFATNHLVILCILNYLGGCKTKINKLDVNYTILYIHPISKYLIRCQYFRIRIILRAAFLMLLWMTKNWDYFPQLWKKSHVKAIGEKTCISVHALMANMPVSPRLLLFIIGRPSCSNNGIFR